VPVRWWELAGAAGAFLVAVALLAWVFGDPEVRVGLEAAATPRFASLCGTIGVTVGGGSRAQRFRLRQGQLMPADGLPPAPWHALGHDPFGAARLVPALSRRTVTGAYLVSPDRRLVAAAIEYWDRPRPAGFGSPTGFVIVDLSTRQLVAEVEHDPLTSVRGFAWAPDSRHLAVLERTMTSQLTRPQHWLFALAGHPAQYYRLTLAVYAASGQRVARSILFPTEMRGSEGEVVWPEGCAG
jgi:hypothetical protein